MPVKYTHETLQTAAQRTTSLDEMLILLDRVPPTERRTYLRRCLTEHAIDTSHFKQRGTIYTEELLREAVAASCSVAGVVRYLNQREAGGTQAHIGRRIKAFGIDTSHFTGQAHNRGKISRTKLPPEEVLVQRPWGAKRLPGVRIRRALADLGRPELCEGCGTGPEWQGTRSRLKWTTSTGTGRTTARTTCACSARTATPPRTPTADVTRTGVAGMGVQVTDQAK